MALRATPFLVLALLSCSDTPPPLACKDLAPPACPSDSDADVCADLTCASVYECDDGQWVFVQNCPNSSPEAGVHPADASTEGAPKTPDAEPDAPAGAYGGPGCTDLELPDCSLGTALGCASTPDCCGCQDVYVCANGGWNLWGACTDGGVVAANGGGG
jgi:hypothetical protein